MLGYKITAKNYELNYVRIYDGWFEGSSKVESKAKEAAAKQVIKQVMKLLIGGPAGVAYKVADIVSKPAQGLGAGMAQVIVENLKKINLALAEEGLDNLWDVSVTLSGDFEGAYLIKDREDLASLPKLLAVIPAKDTTDEFMGESVLEAAFMANVNFARYLRNSQTWDFKKQATFDLDLHIDL